MSIFTWIKSNIAEAIATGIQEGVATGLASVTGGEINAVDAEFERIEAKPESATSANGTPSGGQNRPCGYFE